MKSFEDLVDKGTKALLDCRGFHYTDDPIEYGQYAYDITQQTKDEVRIVLKAVGLKEGWKIRE